MDVDPEAALALLHEPPVLPTIMRRFGVEAKEIECDVPVFTDDGTPLALQSDEVTPVAPILDSPARRKHWEEAR